MLTWHRAARHSAPDKSLLRHEANRLQRPQMALAVIVPSALRLDAT